MTWADLITLAYLDLNVFDGIDAIPARAQVIGLQTLNGFIDYLGTKRLSMWTINRQVFNLIANQQTYAMGPNSPDPGWNVPRPTQIYRAGVILDAYSNPPLEKPCDIITDAQYAATRIKALPSTFPTEVYDDGSWPNANIWWYPLPQVALPVTLYVPQAVTVVTDATQEISLPPGYQDMLEYNLVKRLGPKWSVAPNSYFLQMADETLLAIMGSNQPELLLRTDRAMRGNATAGYNIYTGGFGRRGNN